MQSAGNWEQARILSAILVLAAGVSTAHAQPTSRDSQTTVPFVGCASDGQVGPIDAPKGTAKRTTLPAAVASRLAYYKAQRSPGILAPRGWKCFSTYGSNGASLFVAPELPPPGAFFSDSDKWKGFAGSVIQISNMDGGTSGRFSVAETIALVFPKHRAFAKRVLNEHLGLDKLPSGPFPTDTLHYVSPEVVEYTTPSKKVGLGTKSWLLKNSTAIKGVEILQTEEPNCISVSVRLPPEFDDLTRTILNRVELENPPNSQHRPTR
jgi:hypothetical protein